MEVNMKSQFVALPVKKGDSFLFMRGGSHYLIDGGEELSCKICRYIKGIKDNSLVLICTHNDSDHANGILELLKLCPNKVKEVWLPGSWSYRLTELLCEPAFFFNHMLLEFGEKTNRTSDWLHCDKEDGKIHVTKFWENQEENPKDERDLVHEISGETFQGKQIACVLVTSKLEEHPGFMSALTAANRIRNIALEALCKKKNIRWFKYHISKPKGGDKNNLEPINSRECPPFKVSGISRLGCLALTVTNQYSLAFYAPETEEYPSVMFTADTDLKNIELLENIPTENIPTRDMIVTAPHHGSRDNSNVYDLINNWYNPQKIHWVRSDSINRERPCCKYLQQDHRYCTICRGSAEPKQQTVDISSDKGNWDFSSAIKCSHKFKLKCKCKCKLKCKCKCIP